MMSVTHNQQCRVADCSRASDRQQRTLGRQQSDDECAAPRAAAKTRTADVAAKNTNVYHAPFYVNSLRSINSDFDVHLGLGSYEKLKSKSKALV